MNEQSTRRRVKLYALNSERQWDDRGTGHVTSTYVEKLQGVSLLVRAESDGSLLLESKILRETVYQKQQETLIVWSEGENFDLALSFQEKAGCDEIWEKICQVHGCDPSVDITQDVVEESEDERFDDLSDTFHIELPPAEMSRLPEISQLFGGCVENAAKREKLSLALEADDYIPKLMRVFHMCEDLEDLNGLHHLHDIIKNLFYLNKNPLLEAMFKDETLFDVVGCLEYDSTCTTPKRHRQYLRQMANFKEVLPIRNGELLAKIHQTYRIQYLQDVVLPTPSVFEDNVLSSLSSFIFFNKLDIVKQLQADEKFLSEFFSLLCEEKTSLTKRRDLVLFLKEFCSFSHTLQPQNKETFFKTLSSLGVLTALETTLTVDTGAICADVQTVKAACIDILMYIVETVPALVREYMLRQEEACDDDQLLLNLILEQMVYDRDPDVGSAVQLSGIVRTLIDPDNMMAALNRSEKTEFLSFFYKHCMHNLVAPLLSNTTQDAPLHDDPCTVQLMNLILELLAFCVEHHTLHAKNFIITRNMVARILVLMRSKHKYLALDALRFLRKMVAMKDESYNRHIVKQNLFAPVVEAFSLNHGRYNLLDSAVIELFEFIKTEDIKLLLSYSVETFGEQLLGTDYVPTFRSLKQRYEQQQDRLRERGGVGGPALDSVPSILRGAAASRFRRDPRQLDEDEEMWFNDETDFEESSPLDHHQSSAVEPVTDSPSPPGSTAAPPPNCSAATVDQLEQIGKIIESRGKLGAASLNSVEPLKPLSDAVIEVADRSATPHVLTLANQSSPLLFPTKKVGLVDYDADSDEDAEEESELPCLTSAPSGDCVRTPTGSPTTAVKSSSSPPDPLQQPSPKRPRLS